VVKEALAAHVEEAKVRRHTHAPSLFAHSAPVTSAPPASEVSLASSPDASKHRPQLVSGMTCAEPLNNLATLRAKLSRSTNQNSPFRRLSTRAC